jgi:putative transposon-encoded protein
MKKVKIEHKTEIQIKNIEGFIKRKVTRFGTSAKVDCPKEYLGRDVYLVILKDENKQIS